MGIPTKTSIPLPPPLSGKHFPACRITKRNARAPPMIYSYTQIANYLRCPRSYRYRYLDGWRERDTRAALIFGRCFEKALEAYFCENDCGATLYQEWGAYREAGFEYKKG